LSVSQYIYPSSYLYHSVFVPSC